MKINKTWRNVTSKFIFEIKEVIVDRFISYEAIVIAPDGNEYREGMFNTYESAKRNLKKVWAIEGRFKIKRAPRKKVNAVKVEYDGHEFDSMTERDFYIHMSNNKIVSDIQLHKSFHLLDGYEIKSIVNKKGTKKVRPKIYTPDLVCHIEGVGYVAFDVKGSKLSIPRDFSLRKHMFEQQYGIELVVAIYKKSTGEWEMS
ncbi:hypothetical protein CN446_14935 [Bacillus cereus]|nr:hypothetical protein CN446_14935 [Bacillus cereus]